MQILTINNTPFNMNELPNEIDELHYCVLDYSDLQAIDYYFIPLIFLESFSSPAADLKIGPYRIQVPLDWSIIIGDKHQGDLEIIQLVHLNDRDFTAFAFNPIRGYMPSFFDIEIVNVFQDVKWFTPKLKFGNILAVPLAIGDNPLCVYIVKDIQKLPEVLDITKLV
jgi:hypothetical protein